MLRFSRIVREKFDVVVVGGGPGGYVAAIRAAQLGLNTACVESRGSLGGTCLNVGCIPSKALLHASHKYHDAKHTFAKSGISGAEHLKVDVGVMMKQKAKAVRGLTKGIEGLFKANKVKYFPGKATFGSDPKSISVALNAGGEETVTADHVVLAVGSKVAGLPGFSGDIIDEKDIVSSTGALDITDVPESLTVIGGGVIGLELGSVWSRLGAKVNVVEFMPEIVAMADKDVSSGFQKILKKQGLNFLLSAKVTNVEKTSAGVKVTYEKDGQSTDIVSSKVLVCVGRKPNTSGIGLEGLGCDLDKVGRIAVDAKLNVVDGSGAPIPGLYAIGDAVVGPMLAHKAEEDGVHVVEGIASGHQHDVDYKAVPSVVYTHPEVAWVGQTEQDLKEKGIDYVKSNFPLAANSRARANDEADGFVKILANKEDRLLGAHIIAQNAGDIIMPLVSLIHNGGTVSSLATTCFAHPSVSEAVKESAMGASAKIGKFIHMPN